MATNLPKWKIDKIKEEYAFGDLDKLSKELDVSRDGLTHAANIRGIKRKISSNALSLDRAKLIAEHYPKGDLDWLSSKTGQSKHALNEWARKRGIKRKTIASRNGDMSILLNNSVESLYWLGFIAADGYIYKNGHMMVSQIEKDKEQIYKLAEYLKSKVYIYKHKSGFNPNIEMTCYRLNLSHKTIGQKIRYDLFKINDTISKTYSGIQIEFIKNPNQLYAFLCGFIDGDGYISKSNSIRLEIHKSWYNTLHELSQLITKYDITHTFNLTYSPGRSRKSNKYACLVLNVKLARHLKQFAIDNLIPINGRKWSNIII